MREEPIISGAWVKAALVILVGGALGVGAYVLVSGVDIELPDLPDIEEIDSGTDTTNFSDTTLENASIGEPEPQPPAATEPLPQIEAAQELNRCIQAAGNDIDEVTACFDRFSR
jgi:hypothetical protein